MHSFKDLLTVDYTATGDELLAKKAKARKNDDTSGDLPEEQEVTLSKDTTLVKDPKVKKVRESMMALVKKHMRGVEAKSKAADHWDKAMDAKGKDDDEARKHMRKAVRYSNVGVKEETEISEAIGQGGRDYEDVVNAKLKKHGKAEEHWGTAGSSADAPDAKFKHNGKEHNVEIKADHKAMFGQMELHHDGEKWDVSEKSKKKYPETYKAIQKTKFVDHINRHWKKPSGDYETDLKMGNVYHEHPNADPVKAHYGKDRKTPYIQIGKGHGFYHTGTDAADLGSPELQGKTQLRARMKPRSTDPKTGKRKYGALIVMSLKDVAKSHHDLDAEVKESFSVELSWLREDIEQKLLSESQDPCWDKYKMVGMKKGKDGDPVPNCVPEEVEIEESELLAMDEAVLSPSQRVRKAQILRRNKARIKIGKMIASRRLASKQTLQKRSTRRARKLVLKKILKNRDKSSLSYSARAGYEKLLAKRKAGITRLSRKLLPQVRKADIQKFQKKSK